MKKISEGNNTKEKTKKNCNLSEDDMKNKERGNTKVEKKKENLKKEKKRKEREERRREEKMEEA